jgi:type IV pilus assembly protein PilM
MGLKETAERVRVLFEGTSLDSRLPPAYPPAAIEIAPERVTGVRVARERGNGMVVRAAVTRDLPPGTIEASLVRPNVADPAALGAALDEVLRAVAPGEHRISLLLPDPAARVSLLSFTALPATRKEMGEVVRFRMGKALPFKADEAAMDFMPVGRTAAGAPAAGAVLSVFMHRPILEQYEGLLTARGYWPGLVGLSTLELFNLFRGRLGSGAPDKDLMLLNLTPQYLALLIVSAGQIIFYRCKPHPGDASSEAGLATVKREIYTSLAFYQEKLLGRGLGRVWLRTAGLPVDAATEVVAGEAGCPVERLRLEAVMQTAAAVRLDEAGLESVTPAAGAAAGRRA